MKLTAIPTSRTAWAVFLLTVSTAPAWAQGTSAASAAQAAAAVAAAATAQAVAHAASQAILGVSAAPPANKTSTAASTATPSQAAGTASVASVSVGEQVSTLPAAANGAPPQALAPRIRRHRPARRAGDDAAIPQNDMERAAILWQKTGQVPDVIGSNGSVMYAYGQSRPTITCSPLHLCVIQLMKGEQVTDISIGDSVRWRIAASKAGDTPVIVLKPAAVGLETNLTILTDEGRIYYMTLKSKAGETYVPLVQFYSPEDIVQQINTRTGQLKANMQAQQESKDATLGKLDPATLDFHYTCSGDGTFKPTEVFSGNGHVYLKMPEGMKYGDAPAVFDTTGGSTQLINSRYTRGYEVLDGLPEKFKLAVGVGSEAKTVECAHQSAASTSRSGNVGPWGGNRPFDN